MIEYIEIRDINREIIGIVDTAKSIIWNTKYFGTGDFEIYAQATPLNISLLQKSRYVTRPDLDAIGIIETIHITDSIQDGKMITASGRLAKSILSNRLIYRLSGKTNTPTVLKGNVEQNIRKVVADNAITCSFDSRRNIGILELAPLSNIPDIIVDENGNAAEKQVSYQNLLDYTDAVLQEYELSSDVYLDTDNVSKKLKYRISKGVDRSVDNTSGLDPIIFSTEFDNLTESEYLIDTTTEKNTALIGGEGEGTERFYSLLAPNSTGLERKELWVDASSLNKTLKASELQALYPTGYFSSIYFYVGSTIYATLVLDLEREYTFNTLKEKFPSGSKSGRKFIVSGTTIAEEIYSDDEKYKLTAIGYKRMLDVEEKEGDYKIIDSIYDLMLKNLGKQKLAPLKVTETLTGKIDITSGNYVINRDFWLGDKVTIQDNSLNLYINARIVETTEVQDENGYLVEAIYQ